MALSDDLIAQFAKITKDKTERVKEATVYGNIVIKDDKKYVMIDGSNTLTPVVSTSEANEGERVTVMIKDHTATITGNITNPSSSSTTVGKLAEDYSDVDSRVSDMEDILSGDLDLSGIQEAINSKADKSTVEAIGKRMDNVESDMKDVSDEMKEVSDSMASVAGEVKEKADAKDVEDLTGKMEEIYPMVQEHERILSEGGGPSNPGSPSTPSGPIHLSDETATVEDGFIKNDMIDSVDAGKIKSGTVDLSLVKMENAQGYMKWDGKSLIILNDANNVIARLGFCYYGSINNSFIGYQFFDNYGNAIMDNGGIRFELVVYNNYLYTNYMSQGSGYDLQTYIDALEQELQDMKDALNNNGIYW